MKSITVILLTLFITSIKSYEQNTHTFLIHGIASSANEMFELDIALFNKYELKTVSLELDGDPKTSYSISLDEQCSMYYDKILQHIDIQQHSIVYKDNININLIGISQGGLVARCIIQKYNNQQFNEYTIKFNNLITIATPNSGIYYNKLLLTNDNNLLTNESGYTIDSQYTTNTNISYINTYKDNKLITLGTTFTFEEYWKNPFNYDNYLKQHKFITILNNEINHSNYELYYKNFISLNKFVAIWTEYDTVVVPPESAIFTFYNISLALSLKKLELETLNDNEWYVKDNLGLKYLKESNKYFEYMIPCNHDEFKKEKCFTNNISVPFNKSLLDIIYENI